jgi:hypothetical protein
MLDQVLWNARRGAVFVTYTIVVRNAGATTASDATLTSTITTDDPGSNFTFIQLFGPAAAQSSTIVPKLAFAPIGQTSIIVRLPTLVPGASTGFRVVVFLSGKEGTFVSNTSSVTATGVSSYAGVHTAIAGSKLYL